MDQQIIIIIIISLFVLILVVSGFVFFYSKYSKLEEVILIMNKTMKDYDSENTLFQNNNQSSLEGVDRKHAVLNTKFASLKDSIDDMESSLKETVKDTVLNENENYNQKLFEAESNIITMLSQDVSQNDKLNNVDVSLESLQNTNLTMEGLLTSLNETNEVNELSLLNHYSLIRGNSNIIDEVIGNTSTFQESLTTIEESNKIFSESLSINSSQIDSNKKNILENRRLINELVSGQIEEEEIAL